MKTALVLLSLLAVVLCAPLGETEEYSAAADVDSDDSRVKRAKEVMMFGNQQNEASRDMAKRDDPSNNADNEIDKEGLIVAKEPVDIPVSEETPEEEIGDDSETAEAVEDDIIEQAGTEGLGGDDENDNEENAIDENEGNTALETLDGNGEGEKDDQMTFEEYLKELEKVEDENSDIAPYINSLLKESRGYYTQEQDPLYQYYNSYNYSPYRQYQRYRRSQPRIFNGMHFPRSRVLKRGHRTKRQAYYVPDIDSYLPYDDRYADMPYSNYPINDDDLAELLDLLQDNRKTYDDEDMLLNNPYEGYGPYEDLGDVEFDSPIYVPKRQAGLTFVPGIKRSRDFYPYFEEPKTHFAAFVPEKRTMRDYADAYERVMELAAALRQPQYYPDDGYYDGYRRRK